MSEEVRVRPATWTELSGNAREVLGQLFLTGPKWDGFVSSKQGRDELYDKGLIERGNGWQWLTRAGVEVALSTGVGTGWFDGRWYKKIRTSIG